MNLNKSLYQKLAECCTAAWLYRILYRFGDTCSCVGTGGGQAGSIEVFDSYIYTANSKLPLLIINIHLMCLISIRRVASNSYSIQPGYTVSSSHK